MMEREDFQCNGGGVVSSMYKGEIKAEEKSSSRDSKKVKINYNFYVQETPKIVVTDNEEASDQHIANAIVMETILQCRNALELIRYQV